MLDMQRERKEPLEIEIGESSQSTASLAIAIYLDIE